MDAAGKLEDNGKTGGGFDAATLLREILVESSPSQKRERVKEEDALAFAISVLCAHESYGSYMDSLKQQ
jgi:hypothetical protein